MIYTDRVAFVHVPKAGGHACREYLRARLDGVQYLDDAHTGSGSLGHVALRDFEQYTGRDPRTFEAVFAVRRNPYDHQVSQWLFWKDEYARGFQHEARRHAALYPDLQHWLLDPLSDWHVHDPRPAQLHDGRVVQKTTAGGDGYVEFGGFYRYWLGLGPSNRIPPNVRWARFEDLSDSFTRVVEPWCGPAGQLARRNQGPKYKVDPMRYYSPLAVRIVDSKFRHAFAEWYQPFDVDNPPTPDDASRP